MSARGQGSGHVLGSGEGSECPYLEEVAKLTKHRAGQMDGNQEPTLLSPGLG